MPNKPKAHHYIPRSYLQEFTDPGTPGYLWVYPHGSADIRKAAPKTVAFSNYYYAFIKANGEVDQESFEEILSDVEGAAGAITRALIDRRPLSREEKENYAGFLAVMVLRVPGFRQKIEEAMGNVALQMGKFMASVPWVFNEMTDWLEANGKFDSEGTSREELGRLILADDYKMTVEPQASLRVFTHIGEMASVFADMHWSFVEAPSGKHFITSDNPVSVLNTETHAFIPYIAGMLDPKVEVAFPITRDLGLLARWIEKPDTYCEGSSWRVTKINQRTLVNAQREAYACEKSPALRRFVDEYLAIAEPGPAQVPKGPPGGSPTGSKERLEWLERRLERSREQHSKRS